MKKINDKAFVMSVHQDVSPEVLRINLRWRGNHEISDFDLAGLGKVLHAEAETENAGWVIIEHPRFVKPGDELPLRGKTECFHRILNWSPQSLSALTWQNGILRQ